jgi:hypothetical protein
MDNTMLRELTGDEGKLSELLDQDTQDYLSHLKKNKLSFKLSK